MLNETRDGKKKERAYSVYRQYSVPVFGCIRFDIIQLNIISNEVNTQMNQ